MEFKKVKDLKPSPDNTVDSDTSKAVFKLFSIDLSKIEASLKKDAVKRKKGAVKK